MVADKLGMKPEAVEDFILEGEQLKELDLFMAPSGHPSLLFYYQPPKPSTGIYVYCTVLLSIHMSIVCILMTEILFLLSSDKGQPSSASQRSQGERLWVTDGTKEAYTGTCLFFIRLNTNKPITMANIHQVRQDMLHHTYLGIAAKYMYIGGYHNLY